MPGDCAGPLKKEKLMGDFCVVRQREGRFGLNEEIRGGFPARGSNGWVV